MKVELQVDVERGLAIVRVMGLIDFDVLAEGTPDLLAHEDFRPGMPTVFDLRGASMEAVSAAQMRRTAELNRTLAERRGDARIAAVAGDDLSFGVARMYEVLGNTPHLTFAVFREMHEAEAWALGGDAAR